jgi:hypothetical protein
MEWAMRAMERRVLLRKLDKEMRYYRLAAREENLTSELLRTVRKVLRVPMKEMAEKMGTVESTVFQLEGREGTGSITLRSLEQMAEAMGCKVVYGVVPLNGKTLEQLAEERMWRDALGSGVNGASGVRRKESGVRRGPMAEIVATSRTGKRKGSRAGKTAGLPEPAELTGLDAVAGEGSGTGKTQKRKVKGYGVDRLRRAAERRMAEGSEALAQALMENAIKGKLESVKILIKLAEEEKARREEEREEETPGFADILIGSVARVGEVWDGQEWKKLAKGMTLHEALKAYTPVNKYGDVLEKAA